MLLKVFFHDRCFDGTASAALFGRFYRDEIAAGARVAPVGVRHRDGDPFERVVLDGDDHACVDFRYSPAPAMRWWFDHHRTAFQPPELREVFDTRRSPTHWFDPDAPSCTGLIARALADRYGWTPPPAMNELIRWADIIDAATFPSAVDAVALASPAQRLAVFVGAVDDDTLVTRYINRLSDGASLEELEGEPWVRAVLDPLLDGRERMTARLAELGQRLDDVVVFDLLDLPELPSPGFAGYALFPECRYTVSATHTHGAIKIGLGFNPWGPLPRAHDLGALCEQHGGGGHAAVGGVTLRADENQRARATVAALIAALTSSS